MIKPITVKGIRTSRNTNLGQELVDVTIEMGDAGDWGYDHLAGEQWFRITKGGVTGHESLCPANAHPSWKPSSGWAACMGCTKYDRLFIPGPEMVRALKFFGVKDFDPK